MRPGPVTPAAPVSTEVLWAAAGAVSEDAVFAVDWDGSIRGWTGSATRMFGWGAEDIEGWPAARLFATDDDATAFALRLEAASSLRHAAIGPASVVPCPALPRGEAPDRSGGGALAGSGAGPVGEVVPVGDGGRSGPGSLVLNDHGGRCFCGRLGLAVLPDASGVCVVVRDVTAEEASATHLHHQSRLLGLFHGITRVSEESRDLLDGMHRSLMQMCQWFDWPVGQVTVLGPDGGPGESMRYVADRDKLTALPTAGILSGLARRAVTEREPVWSATLPDGPLGRAGLSSGFAFPILSDNSVIAVFELYSLDVRIADRQLMDVAVHAAAQLGRMVAEEKTRALMAEQATRDSLTGLPNRTLFMDQLARAAWAIKPATGQLAVLFVDLDHFKLINDGLGHEVGDLVLRTAAERLVDILPEGAAAARFGGDEFVLMYEHWTDPASVAELAEGILRVLSQPMLLGTDGGTVITASVGIATTASPDTRPETLLRDADAAVFRAKEDGRDRYQVFSPALHERARRKLSIGNELRRAVANEELRLEYQPQFRIADGRLIGVEALVRWDNPQRGTLPPGDWIPVAEETQLIVPIGEWIMEEACRAGACWADESAAHGGGPLKVCVNVSAVQLARPELVDAVVSSLKATGLDASSLCIEITESVLMGAPGTYLEALLGLKLLGLTIAVDDFGTGYSSLAYLRRFPIDLIKVDKGFIDGLDNADPRGRSIMDAVIRLSEALGVTPVAEGVERVEQAAVLAGAGCYGVQGFLYSPPVGPETISALIRAGGQGPVYPVA